MGGILLDHDRVLLVERGTEPLKGYWSLPGGVLELGERVKDGVRREVREETGLIVEPLDPAEIFERIILDSDGNPEYHYVLMDYVCRVTGGALAPASDVSRAVWVPRRLLSEYRITEGTVAVIEKAFLNHAAFDKR